MAHFAELDENNIVIRVLVFSDTDIANNGGEYTAQSEQWIIDSGTPFYQLKILILVKQVLNGNKHLTIHMRALTHLVITLSVKDLGTQVLVVSMMKAEMLLFQKNLHNLGLERIRFKMGSTR